MHGTRPSPSQATSTARFSLPACMEADSTEAPRAPSGGPRKSGPVRGRSSGIWFRSEDRRYLGLKKACARSEDRVGNVWLVHDFPNLLAAVVADQYVPDLLRLLGVKAHAGVKSSVTTTTVWCHPFALLGCAKPALIL